MLFPSSPCCKHVKLEDVSLFPFSLLFNPAGCTPNSQPFSKSPFTPFKRRQECYELIPSPPRQSDAGVTPACCSKLPLYRRCANTSLCQLRLRLHGSFTALEADTPRLLSYLQSCRSRVMAHSLLCACQSPSQAHK